METAQQNDTKQQLTSSCGILGFAEPSLGLYNRSESSSSGNMVDFYALVASYTCFPWTFFIKQSKNKQDNRKKNVSCRMLSKVLPHVFKSLYLSKEVSLAFSGTPCSHWQTHPKAAEDNSWQLISFNLHLSGSPSRFFLSRKRQAFKTCLTFRPPLPCIHTPELWVQPVYF